MNTHKLHSHQRRGKLTNSIDLSGRTDCNMALEIHGKAVVIYPHDSGV